MKLFKHSNGMTIAFGFDMIARRPNPHIISWNDPKTGEWETKADNMAGWNEMQVYVDPEFVFELRGGTVVAFQPGRCIEMTFHGLPFVWGFSVLSPDTPRRAAA